jgi:hypothetical protein
VQTVARRRAHFNALVSDLVTADEAVKARARREKLLPTMARSWKSRMAARNGGRRVQTLGSDAQTSKDVLGCV